MVATVLTACGIETFTSIIQGGLSNVFVATVLTACGIETSSISTTDSLHFPVATVLTACGIETDFPGCMERIILKLQQYLPLAVLKPFRDFQGIRMLLRVATVLTAYDIDTYICNNL